MRLPINSMLAIFALAVLSLIPLSVNAAYTVYELPGQTFGSMAEAVAAARAISPAHNKIQLMEITPLSGTIQYQYRMPELNATRDPWRYHGPTVSTNACIDSEGPIVSAAEAGYEGTCEAWGWTTCGLETTPTSGWNSGWKGNCQPWTGVADSERKIYTVYRSCKPLGGSCRVSELPFAVFRTANYQCPEHYSFKSVATSAGRIWKCRGTVGARIYGPLEDRYYVDPKSLKEPAGLCSSAGNPCNPLTGSKFQIETDTSGDGPNTLRFTRYYNSITTQPGQPGKHWQHNFNGSVEGEYQYAMAPYAANEGNSQLFGTRQAACEQGWSQIQPNVNLFDAALLTAVWEGESCHLYNGLTRTASLPVLTDNSTLGDISNPLDYAGTLVAYEVHRPNGARLRFIKLSGTWQVTPPGPYKLTEVQAGLQLTDANNNVETYNTSGQLLSITDANGNTTTLSYGSAGELIRVENTRGEFFDFTYVNEQLATLTDHTGRTWTYGHDGVKNLTSVTHPDGTVKQYHYENASFSHALTGITDENGVRYGTYAYDAQGRAISTEHIGGVDKVTIAYPNDTTRVITNSRGEPSTYTLTTQAGIRLPTSFSGPGCATCGSTNTTYEYNSNNQITARSKDGITTHYADYDAFGNAGSMTEAVGTGEQRQTVTTYDARFMRKPATVTEPSVYASGNKITTYSYDDFANLTDVTVNGFTPNGTPVSRSIGLQYAGPLGQLSLIDGPRTDVTDHYTFDYYPDDPALGADHARLQRVTDPNGLLLRNNLHYTASGKLASEQRPNNLTLHYSYYAGNDRLKQIDQVNGTGTRSLAFTWLPSGELESLTRGHGTPDAVTLTLGYDLARRLTSITDGLGNKVEYELDTEGNRTATHIKDASGALKRSLSQTFDAYNRLDVFSQANEAADHNYAADGTLDQLTDGNGRVSDFNYDALKRLVERTDDLGGSDVTTKDALAQFDYNVHDDLTQVTDANGNATTYAYDDLGNLLSQSSPDTGLTTFVYDAAGNVTQRTDAKGQVFAYSYDAAGRLTSIDAPGTTDDASFTYDSCDHGAGRVCAISTAGGSTVNYTYTAFGDVTAHQGVGYAYTAAGQVGTMVYPSGRSVTYTYDAAGQINDVSTTDGGSTQTLASGISYEPFGPLKALTYGNGLTLAQALDTAYRLTQQRVPGVFERDYTAYDGNGNIGQITDVLNTASDVFTYDALNRLDIAVGGFGNQDFSYDKNGNRTALSDNGTPLSYSYAANSNRLTTAANDAVMLDANGITTSKGTWTYTHNVNNRLVTATDNGTPVASYAYNALGQRFSKTVGGNAMLFVFGLNGELLAELDSSGTVLREYVYLNGAPLAVIDAATIHYMHTDHLGTPRGVSDSTATLVWSWNSDPFGRVAANDDADGDGSAFVFNLRFPGQYYDSETGLHYNYFRDYDPSTGRYVQSDPIGLAGGDLSTFTYVWSNPQRWIDPDGLRPTYTPPPYIPPRRGSNRNSDRQNGAEGNRNRDRKYGTPYGRPPTTPLEPRIPLDIRDPGWREIHEILKEFDNPGEKNRIPNASSASDMIDVCEAWACSNGPMCPEFTAVKGPIVSGGETDNGCVCVKTRKAPILRPPSNWRLF